MQIKEYLTIKQTDENKHKIYYLRDRLTCKDGFSMSVQANKALRCTPQATLLDGEYEAVEIGFPSALEQLLVPYMDDEAKTAVTKTIYNYVPLDVVEEVIVKHGGIA
ncbi:MAG: hypothetical protein ATN35_04315 [Epulopiscium sp. Nele67-Bin004]|nr:MAG: hypothetical protein ATN35_04315 [Epulopiscium sp. Nele67-Bin004]